MSNRQDVREQHTLAVLADNEPGVMARVIGLFSGRGYNIDSLTVSEVVQEKHLSRFTIVTTGSPMVIEQIRNQLARLVPVHAVTDMTVERQPDRARISGRGVARHSRQHHSVHRRRRRRKDRDARR